MKVGTDGVLLGAWVNCANKSNVLDIGTGTGLIALMIAQRNPDCAITALEIEEDAYLQALHNIKQSNWSNQISIYNTSLQNFTTNTTFDCIISNPPFYTDTVKQIDTKRKLARHIDSLTFNELLNKTASLLSKNGEASFIIPYSEEANFIKIAKSHSLFPKKITHVKGRENTAIKRSLLTFTFTKDKQVHLSELIIEIDRHVYTEDYINLTKDFYLKM